MSFSSESLVPFLHELCEASAEILLRHFRAPLDVQVKADLSPVTVADQSAEQALRAIIGRRFPDHGIIGEEFGAENGNAEFVWVLDPIDGTKTFVSGVPLFGTLIALLREGRPVLSAINLPALSQRLIGCREWCELNGARVRMRETASIAEATLLATDHLAAGRFKDQRTFDTLARSVKMYRTWGDCYGYALLASGFADIMVDPVMSPWDTFALIPVVEGAGGIITSWEGGDPIDGSSALAASRRLHPEVLRILNESSGDGH